MAIISVMGADNYDIDAHTLTIGQLAWMNNDLLLSRMWPCLLQSPGALQAQVDCLIANAYRDLYNPILKLSTHLHVVHAIMCVPIDN